MSAKAKSGDSSAVKDTPTPSTSGSIITSSRRQSKPEPPVAAPAVSLSKWQQEMGEHEEPQQQRAMDTEPAH
ncbi:GH15643 [Drosophila grimshawi]|uniref:GH15643 n=1 Tax=Drosophila grimshawi TaxID=7222 RepID=B4JUK1_DROGR|nr:GH15643 [Drosophila grimshawi]